MELEAADVVMTQLQTKLPLLQRDSLLTMETLQRSERAMESDETHPNLLKLSLSMMQVETETASLFQEITRSNIYANVLYHFLFMRKESFNLWIFLISIMNIATVLFFYCNFLILNFLFFRCAERRTVHLHAFIIRAG